ncbi:MAG: hypothetical protein GWN58_33155 [Anaerolineae bacterium]|nr:hypothetical protein [Thermoplasmata archaeon]NIV34124.1 hypothetical protein [Anaerolineae bacterium]NIY05975.1 hypothetical protein [Thermoplasmata archaeon]
MKIHKAPSPYSSARLSGEQKSLLLAMQILYPKKILICFRQRDGRWAGGVFLIGRGRKFYPRTMDGLWRRGLVQYQERRGGDRLYSLTKHGFSTVPA